MTDKNYERRSTMKKSRKIIISLICVIALIASLGVGALAYTDEEIAEIASNAQRALDVQAVENIMNRHVMYHCYGEHREEMEELWVQEPENQATASFGQNQGFMVGYGSIWDGYVTGHDESWLSSAKRYCQNNGIDVSGWTDDQILEVYGGVGQLLLHVTTTAIIEIAEDGKTAKGFWYSPGMIAESGQTGNTIWEAYGVDFVKEGDEWKMWHLHMFTDFMGSFYLTLGGSGEPNTSVAPTAAGSGEAPADSSAQGDMTQVDEFLRHEYLSSPQYSEFSKHRLRSEMEVIPIPVPYESWSFDVPNFGPTADEWASIGVDLNAWYAAHS